MSKYVLMIEDDHVLRRLFCDILSHFDCEIAEASTLEEANQYLDDRVFDFVLCDIHLREGNALGIAERCLQGELPVIIVSSDDSYIKYFEDTGVLAFLVKPVHIPDLVNIVQNFDELQSFRTVRYPD